MTTLVYGHHKVKDYASWRPLFDKDEERRRSFGVKNVYIMSRDGDPNDVHFLFEAESKEKFNECFSAPELAGIMQEAGVLEKPEPVILNIVS